MPSGFPLKTCSPAILRGPPHPHDQQSTRWSKSAACREERPDHRHGRRAPALPDPGNYPIDGGTGTVDTNPAAMKVWRAQSVLTYQVGNRTYAKSRTVLRSQ